MKLKIKKIHDDAVIPSSGTTYSAGYDLYSVEDAVIDSNSTKMVHTGLSLEIPEGYFGGIFARSGLACKRNLRPANCVGVIDADYRGEIIVALHNDGELSQFVQKGERIAQLVIMPFIQCEFEEVESLNDTARATGGFGSTGK